MYARNTFVGILCTLLLTLWIGETWQWTGKTKGLVDDKNHELRGVGDNIHVGQIWSYDVVVPQSMTLAYVVIKEINSANSTLAGYYGTRINGTMLVYPFHGEYDPSGVTIGWIVSYRNQTDNQHATCVWTGYYEYAGGYPKHIFYMTKVIANEAYATTTTETEVFQLTT